MSIHTALLGDVVSIKGGGTPSKSQPAFYTGNIPWVTPKDMKFWDIITAQDKITDEAVRSSATNVIPENAILIVNRSGILKHTLPVGINRLPVAINQDIKALICGPLVEPDYLARIIKAAESIILGWVRATTADNFPIDKLRELEIPLPSFEEQKRIAAILDQADSLLRLRQRASDRLSSLAQAIFYEMFGFQSEWPEKWPKEKLGNLCKVVRGSSPRPQGDTRFFGGRVPRLMIADITRDGMLVTPRIDSLTDAGALRSRPMRAGSVVMAVSGAVGLPAILQLDACIHDGFVGFQELDERIDAIFLYQFLNLQRAQNKSKGTGAIWVNLTTDQVKDFDVPVPANEHQVEFRRRLDKVGYLDAINRKGDESTNTLFHSLQARAFRGEL